MKNNNRKHTRYLTQEEKTRELHYWYDYMKELPPRPAHQQIKVEDGIQDSEMIPWCNLINELPDVCTLQSCSGHKYPDGSMCSGALWLRLTEKASNNFDKFVFNLSKQKEIESVSRDYTSYGEEVIEIYFRGIDFQSVNKAMEKVLEFVEKL